MVTVCNLWFLFHYSNGEQRGAACILPLPHCSSCTLFSQLTQRWLRRIAHYTRLKARKHNLTGSKMHIQFKEKLTFHQYMFLQLKPPLRPRGVSCDPAHAHTELWSKKKKKTFVLCRVKPVRYVRGSAEISQGHFLKRDELDSNGEVGGCVCGGGFSVEA